jgi:hypothetical protein
MELRSRKLTRTPNPAPIADEEWDFSRCPEEQLKTCMLYEYCRSSEALKRLAQFVRQHPHRINMLSAIVTKTKRLLPSVTLAPRESPQAPPGKVRSSDPMHARPGSRD